MSFYTSLTGLNGAQADIAAISNNIANVGTTGFKRSRAEFGDIFATSPLQAASSAIGSGTILKSIKQQFTQGNIESSLNALDLAISGQGFFALKPSLTSTQTVYTRNGAFSVNNDRYVVDAQGQLLQVFPVNADGSVIATGINSAKNLQLPTTSGLPKASQTIQLGLNLPADAEIIPSSATYTSNNPYVFDKTNPATYNKSTSITIYDSLGNSTIATIYYVKTSNATEASPTNKWQTYVFVGDREVTPQLISAKDDQSRTYYINKFGQITTDPQAVDPTFNAAAPHPLYKQDDQTNKTASTAASIVGGIMKASGFDFGDTDATKVTIVTDPALFNTTRESGTPAASGANPPYWGVDMFSVSVDGSAVQSISINPGSYTGTQLAAELTRAVNARFGGAHYFSITDTYRKENGAVIPGNDIIQLNLSRLAEDGGAVPMTTPLEIDLLGSGGSTGTTPSGSNPAPETKLQLTREELVKLAQTKLNDELNRRHLEFGKPSTWPSPDTPPIVVGYDVASRAFTFTVSPTQLGPDANEPSSRFNSIQVYNPTDTLNDLGIPPKTTSSDVLIRTNTLWTGSAALPGGDSIVDPREQRTGIKVTYNKDTRQFAFNSGSTGEASTITVGRAQLATSADVQPQVDSFNLETMDFSTDKKLTLEVNGRQLVYNYNATITPETDQNDAQKNSTTDNIRFFQGMEQAIPVTFADENKVTPGSSTVFEVQSFMAYGKIMAGDEFHLNIAGAPGATAQTITVGPLGLGNIAEDSTTGEPDKIDKNTSVGSQLKQLKNAINKALTTAGFTGVQCDADANRFTLTYKTYGAVATIASLKQTVRGSNALDTRVLNPVAANAYVSLTDATIVPSTPKILDGTTTTQTEQRISLTKTDGLAPIFAAGDVFRITVPMADGTEAVDDIAISPLPAVGGVTPSLLDCLVASANASKVLTNVTFTRADTGNTLIATWKNNGHITGAMSIEQVGKGDENPLSPVPLTGIKTNLNRITPPATTASIGRTLDVTSTADLVPGMIIAGDKIPPGTTIVSILPSNQIIISSTPTGAIAAGTATAYGTTKVRPENIGPFSVKGNAPVLEVAGDPTGKPFRLNLRVDGVVRAKEPVGAQGSTSLNGLQIGAAKVLNYSGSNDLLGVGDKYSAQQIFVAGTGLSASPAQAVGARGVTPMNQTFMLNENLGENKMTFTVDGIVGTITLPVRAYTGDTFASAIQDRVNQIQDPVTGRIVSGVTVKFEPDQNRLVFTSGTAGSNSQINVVGHPNFGLAKVTQTAGSIPIITNLKQATDEQGNKLYVDTEGNVSTQQPGALQNWFPLYLQEGQLTFDTIGKLISPKEGVIYSPFDPQNGSDLLRLNIDYGKFSTQFSSPFSVLSLSQDGYPSGSLNGLDIDASGTIRANYTNGQTTALGKVMVANFANANGLKQIGNANYVATSVSGQVVLGQAGADGFGTIKAGALERSNVDITEELVNLITAQRNFQANAKAIETTTTLSQTIIQIRG